MSPGVNFLLAWLSKPSKADASLDKEIFMFNVCPKCGEYSVEKSIDASGPFAFCPFCGYTHLFLQLRLFLITGSSGSGKTTICLEFISLVHVCVILEAVILWVAFPATEVHNYRDYRNLCLLVAINVGQIGR